MTTTTAKAGNLLKMKTNQTSFTCLLAVVDYHSDWQTVII